MDELTISKIMVNNNKKRVPLQSADKAIYIVDIFRSANKINDLYQKEIKALKDIIAMQDRQINEINSLLKSNKK